MYPSATAGLSLLLANQNNTNFLAYFKMSNNSNLLSDQFLMNSIFDVFIASS